ncbi:hypothetical protein EDD17DRAFT_1763931 [Pisolithus thermaeus]|nr:hypothetical protein EDD17DRAFT_1763931 [Pisolithus thermaeus]
MDSEDSSGELRDGRSAPKRSPDDKWTQGHHIPKSSKADVTSVAPQIDKSIISEEQAARTSQLRLLSTLKQMMWGQSSQGPILPPGLPVVAPTSGQPPSRTGTMASSKWPKRPLRLAKRLNPSLVYTVQGFDPADERTPPVSRECMPIYSSHVQQPSTPSSGSTIRAPVAAPSPSVPRPTTIQEILDSQAMHGKGKQRAIKPISLPQSEFHLQGLDLPPWPSMSEPPMPPPQFFTALKNMQAWPQFPVPNSTSLDTSSCPLPVASTPHTLSIPAPILRPAPQAAPTSTPIIDPASSGPRTSSDLPPDQSGPSLHAWPDDTSALSDVKSQSKSHETVMKEISTIREHLSTSNLASKDQPGLGGEGSSYSFRRSRKKAAKRRHFVVADPQLPVTSQDEQEHSVFLRCIHKHTLILLKISGYKYLRNAKCTLSQQQVDEYEQGLPGCLQITATDFMVDCLRNRDSPFNQDAATVFAEDFLEKITRHSWYASAKIPERYHNHETIRTAFIAHLAYVKSRYREVVTAVDEDPDKARRVMNARLQKSSRGSRKLLKMHLDAMADHPTLQ